jgi:hypothetical protein
MTIVYRVYTLGAQSVRIRCSIESLNYFFPDIRLVLT